jgi:isopentenyl-diphosphate Delta-isomerase
LKRQTASVNSKLESRDGTYIIRKLPVAFGQKLIMKEQEVVLVNENDEPIGLMEKMEAHQKGLLHRAFSVFIFDTKGNMLLQQRSADKYHGAHLWTNACCSHPFPDETVKDAAQRRLKEELGFTTELHEIFFFTYHAKVENDLIEHEFDHVFAGEYDKDIYPNVSEVADFTYRPIDQIKKEIEVQPEKFTSWFKIAFPKVEKWWRKSYASKNV